MKEKLSDHLLLTIWEARGKFSIIYIEKKDYDPITNISKIPFNCQFQRKLFGNMQRLIEYITQ